VNDFLSIGDASTLRDLGLVRATYVDWLGLRQNFSVMAWVRSTDWTTSAVLFGSQGDGSGPSFRLGVDGAHLNLHTDYDEMCASSVPPATNQWVHVAFVYEVVELGDFGITVTLSTYFNGIRVANCTNTPSTIVADVADAQLLIGKAAPVEDRGESSHLHFRGDMKDLRLYGSEAKTQPQILEIFDEDKACGALDGGFNGDVFQVRVGVKADWDGVHGPLDIVHTETGAFHVFAEKIAVPCEECESGLRIFGRVVFSVNNFNGGGRCNETTHTAEGASCFAVASAVTHPPNIGKEADTIDESHRGLLHGGQQYSITAYKTARTLVIEVSKVTPDGISGVGTAVLWFRKTNVVVPIDDVRELNFFVENPGRILANETLSYGGTSRGLCVRYSRPGCCPVIKLVNQGESMAANLTRLMGG
jgi:hypothetical protein